MSTRRTRSRKTDYGTIILHWCFFVSLAVAVVTGLRIAAEEPDRTWINALDALIPRTPVWTWHMKASIALSAAALAYAIYLPLAGLGRRVQFDRVRLAGLLGGCRARWGAINVALYWAFYAVLLAQIASGVLLYFGYAGAAIIAVHWYGTWALLAYAPIHVLAQWRLGGAAQLLRIFRPARLAPAPPAFDPTDLLALLDAPLESPPAMRTDQEAGPAHPAGYAQPGLSPPPVRASDHAATSPGYALASGPDASARPVGRTRGYSAQAQANPFVVAISVAVVGIGFVLIIEPETIDTLHVRRIGSAEIPILDGDMSDPVWRKARPLHVMTSHGANFDGRGESEVEIRAVHDGLAAYFLFVWDDPTRSLKHLPLIKEVGGWRILRDGYEAGDERAYHEDKFAMLLTKLNVMIAGDRTFHAGPAPAPGKPGTLSRRGLHYTLRSGLYVDVWQWRATSTSPFGVLDDGYFGPPAEPTQAQRDGVSPYKGGYALDPGTAIYSENFEPWALRDDRTSIIPRRLPIDLTATAAALGPVDLDPNHGDVERARWYMTMEESAPYTRERDDTIPTGTIIPGVIVAGAKSGDRADVHCGARWAAGRWVLEATRPLHARTGFDVDIGTGTFMRVAAFDHSQIAHTRHVRPIRLELE